MVRRSNLGSNIAISANFPYKNGFHLSPKSRKVASPFLFLFLPKTDQCALSFSISVPLRLLGQNLNFLYVSSSDLYS
ncbi:hypothetical protein L6452_36543 [Arctium lappa]|uniref:Uncharacterized protein n=1 Tax=Arctium lappa TaxID=4217 RepID=A0ACB8Y9M4_ARCLA|nr:hypothetical protein L6452_36543 [Arctium lappa]